MDGDDSERLAAGLTTRFQTTALIALNADDDVLWLCVYANGNNMGEYDSSTPARAGAAAISRNLGGRARILMPILWLILQSPFFVFEVFRHIAACKVLGLPSDICTFGYPAEDDGTLVEYVPPGMFESTQT